VGTRLAGRTALITGASRGIGRAIAEAFAAEGAALAINARDGARLDEVARALRDEYGVPVHTGACDVTDGAAVRAMVAAAEAWRPLDVLVNNAGIHLAAPFMEYSFEQFREVIESNVYSVFHVTQAVLPGMLARKRGRIVNLASTAGKWGSRNQSAYNASKHAVVGITRCLGLDMATGFMQRHATALGISPAELTARMNASVPLGRWIKPAEVAGLAVYLASDEASYINGQAWTVDGGYTMI